MSNICLITSKNIDFNNDIDGANILINQLIKKFNIIANIDILIFNNERIKNCDKNINELKKAGARNVHLHYLNNICKNKFDDRLNTFNEKISVITNIHSKYDKIMVIHISNIFGIENLSKEIRNKIILFPMFLGLSYKYSNEFINELYIKREKLVFENINKILTPSNSEKKQMIEEYNVLNSKITVIPRGFDLKLLKKKSYNNNNNKIQIVYIAAIRKQKNHIDLIKLMNELIINDISFQIHLIGKSEKDAFEEFFDLVNKNNFNKYIKYHGVVSQNKLSHIISKCDFNISVSKCETFGRGIYEGLLIGLPTIVYKNIECLWENLKDGHGIIGVNSPTEIANEIIKINKSNQLYNSISKDALSYRDKFNEEEILDLMQKKILGD